MQSGIRMVRVVQERAFPSLQKRDRTATSDNGVSPCISSLAIAAIFLISLLPLAVTPVIPTIDFYNHVARYFVLTHIDTVAALRDNYMLVWKLLPNLGLDVLALPFFTILPPLLAAKAIIILIFAVQYGGVLALCRAMNGRVTLVSAFLAGILLYSYILIWGFANFLLANGLSFWCLALWLNLRERSLLLASLACSVFAGLIFLCHGFAFALYGIMLSMLEFGRWMNKRPLRLAPLLRSALAVAVQAVAPAVLFLMTPTAQAGQSAEAILANHDAPGSLVARLWEIGLYQLNAIIRVADSSFLIVDTVGIITFIVLGGWAMRRGVIRLAPIAVPLVIVLCILCVLTPPSLFGVGKIADRIPLVSAMLLTAAIGRGPVWHDATGRGRVILIGGLVLIFTIRIMANMVGFSRYDDDFRDYVSVMQKAPPSAIIGPASPPEARDRTTAEMRCEMYPPLVVPLYGDPAPLFANPTQQPLALKGGLADQTERAKQASTSHDDPLTALQPGFRYYIACGYNAAQIPGFRTLANKGRFLLLEKQ